MIPESPKNFLPIVLTRSKSQIVTQGAFKKTECSTGQLPVYDLCSSINDVKKGEGSVRDEKTQVTWPSNRVFGPDSKYQILRAILVAIRKI